MRAGGGDGGGGDGGGRDADGAGGGGRLAVDDVVEVLVLVLGAGVVGEVARVGDLDDVLLLDRLLCTLKVVGVGGVGQVGGFFRGLWALGGHLPHEGLVAGGGVARGSRGGVGLALGVGAGDLGGDGRTVDARGLGRDRRLCGLRGFGGFDSFGRLGVVDHLLGLLGTGVTHPPAQEAGERGGGGVRRVVGHGHMVPRPGGLVGRRSAPVRR